jgi:hypothetical protein
LKEDVLQLAGLSEETESVIWNLATKCGPGKRGGRYTARERGGKKM